MSQQLISCYSNIFKNSLTLGMCLLFFFNYNISSFFFFFFYQRCLFCSHPIVSFQALSPPLLRSYITLSFTVISLPFPFSHLFFPLSSSSLTIHKLIVLITLYVSYHKLTVISPITLILHSSFPEKKGKA